MQPPTFNRPAAALGLLLLVAAFQRAGAAPPVGARAPSRAYAPVIACAGLLRLDFSGVTDGPARITDAADAHVAQSRAAYCVVRGYVAPTIRFRLDLPTGGWTGRYLQGGCGGNCGTVMSRVAPDCDNRKAYDGSFAVGFEDSGHQGGDGVWALGGKRVREDFAYRAAHAFAVAAKAIIRAYYGRGPAYSYFQGCSDGGREAMVETQRYPRDFDGVIAGSPAFAIAEAMERFIWEARWGEVGGAPVFDDASVAVLHDAVIAACDRLDGVADGQIDDPRRCHYDPALLQCPRAARTARCLTREQVTAARKFYLGPVDSRGRHLYFGGEPYGSELTWAQPFSLATAGAFMLRETVGNMIFLHRGVPASNPAAWPFDAAHLRELSVRGAVYDARDSDLSAFRARGGRLILWQGFADPAAGAYGLPDYYARVARNAGGLAAARGFVRLFMVPAVYHCEGGYVPYQEDYLGAIVDWVERGVAPDDVMAVADMGHGRRRERPVYAYPVEARYVGHGDVDDPRSFEPRMPAHLPSDEYRWIGEAAWR